MAPETALPSLPGDSRACQHLLYCQRGLLLHCSLLELKPEQTSTPPQTSTQTLRKNQQTVLSRAFNTMSCPKRAFQLSPPCQHRFPSTLLPTHRQGNAPGFPLLHVCPACPVPPQPGDLPSPAQPCSAPSRPQLPLGSARKAAPRAAASMQGWQ